MVTLIIAKLYINQKSKLTKRYSQHQTQLILVLIYLLARTNLYFQEFAVKDSSFRTFPVKHITTLFGTR
ncbi:hypothetical protein CICLE_v10003068mg [Citrus x clementina]|uniref:Uncharacterized protein n=1 Tax=Citrus clementina TaxID=85681 RepID=V4T2D7_CITCL|nr:hypothetical protein CICLE_v10003068mg [Citrus x clementina]